MSELVGPRSKNQESEREFLGRHSTEYARWIGKPGHADAYTEFVLAEYDAYPDMFTYWDHAKAWPIWFERSNQ